MWAQHTTPNIKGSSGIQILLVMAICFYISVFCLCILFFSCSKFILQLRPERSTGHGWSPTHIWAVPGTIGPQDTRQHIRVQATGGSWRFAHLFTCLFVFRQDIQWNGQRLSVFLALCFPIVTQSLHLLGTGGIVGHIADGRYFHVHTQSFS